MFSAKQWGTFGLTTANQQIQPLNLLEHYENVLTSGTASTDVARCTVLGIRGYIAFYYGPQTDASTDDYKQIGFGIRTESTSVVEQLDALPERQAVSPYHPDTKAPWDGWMWRRSRPVVPQPPVPDGTSAGIDPLATMWSYRFGVNTHNMRKLRMGESLYLFGGINFDPASGGDIQCFYDFTIGLARP